ncbi:hypothetical protein [Sphingobacterium sp.]|uniref:hypothetical protein n=1 Tax=Sphingobacterium sp. TaxID=341027 RepID=UPI00289D9CEE|nr:hypothetical protein [Sphingobacterium sp.]
MANKADGETVRESTSETRFRFKELLGRRTNENSLQRSNSREKTRSDFKNSLGENHQLMMVSSKKADVDLSPTLAENQQIKKQYIVLTNLFLISHLAVQVPLLALFADYLIYLVVK